MLAEIRTLRDSTRAKTSLVLVAGRARPAEGLPPIAFLFPTKIGFAYNVAGIPEQDPLR